jgi:hypothetical protein
MNIHVDEIMTSVSIKGTGLPVKCRIILEKTMNLSEIAEKGLEIVDTDEGLTTISGTPSYKYRTGQDAYKTPK